MNAQEIKVWVSNFKTSSIRNEEDLSAFSIRQLKALATKLNKEEGQIICKAKFGKVYSRMTKAELSHAIWVARAVQLMTRTYITDLKKLSTRVFTYEKVLGHGHKYWITYFGFKSDSNGTAQQNAEKFKQYILSKGYCKLAAIRKAKRLAEYNFEYEVKVWGIDDSIAELLIAKDKEQSKQKEYEDFKKTVRVKDMPREEQIEFLNQAYQRESVIPQLLNACLERIERFNCEVIDGRVVSKF